MEVSVQPYAPINLPSWKQLTVPTEQEAILASESGSTY